MKKTNTQYYAIVTNAETGYGRELALSLAKRGYVVLVTAQDEETGKALADDIGRKAKSHSVTSHPLDLSDQKSIRKFAADFRYNVKQLDHLVFNDSLDYLTLKKQQYTDDNIERNWAAYHMGPVVLTGLLLPLLKESSDARVIIPVPRDALKNRREKVQLEDPEFRDHHYHGLPAYHHAKLAQIFFLRYLATQLKESGIAVCGILSPQMKIPRSQLKRVPMGIRMKNRFSKSPTKTAHAVLTSLTCKRKRLHSGEVLVDGKRPLKLSSYLSNAEVTEQVMTLTRKYIIS